MLSQNLWRIYVKSIQLNVKMFELYTAKRGLDYNIHFSQNAGLQFLNHTAVYTTYIILTASRLLYWKFTRKKDSFPLCQSIFSFPFVGFFFCCRSISGMMHNSRSFFLALSLLNIKNSFRINVVSVYTFMLRVNFHWLPLVFLFSKRRMSCYPFSTKCILSNAAGARHGYINWRLDWWLWLDGIIYVTLR